MRAFPAIRFGTVGAILAAGLLASAAAVKAQEVTCTTVGAETKCTEGATLQQARPGAPGAAAADAKPPVTNVGRSGPTRYEVENLRIFGADSQIRLLGNTESKAGQQGAPANSGRNCGTFNTSVYCD